MKIHLFFIAIYNRLEDTNKVIRVDGGLCENNKLTAIKLAVLSSVEESSRTQEFQDWVHSFTEENYEQELSDGELVISNILLEELEF